VQSQAPTVDAYIKEALAERQAALTKLRDLCRKKLKGYSETLEYGMPGYRKGNAVEVSFASQKQNIAVYILKTQVLAAHENELKGIPKGKSCLRFTKPEKIDFALLGKLLDASRQLAVDPCSE
jgi:uncharacterized protein YdhG (YjbR/CyaY superfamily)